MTPTANRLRSHRATFALAVCAALTLASALPLTVASCRTQTAPADERNGVTQALTGFQEARAMAERDIEALSTVAAENFRRAEKTVDQELAQLEKKLDRAENKL